MPDDTETLLNRLIGGDPAVGAGISKNAGTSTSPRLLGAAAVVAGGPADLLIRAERFAVTTRNRQLVAVAAAHLCGDHDLLNALVRDHLADHPDDILAAWITAQHTNPGDSAPSTTGSNHA